MHDNGQGPAPRGLPDLPMPRPSRRGLRTAVAVSVIVVMCAAAVAMLRVLGHGTSAGTTPDTRPGARAMSSADASPRRTPTSVPAGTGIYRLLPLTADQLTAAAHIAAMFTSYYGTYSWTQPPPAYTGRLRPYASAGLQSELADGAAAPGLLQQRARDHASATSTATVTAIRDIAGTTVTFTVTARQTSRSHGTERTSVTEYAVTIAPGADGPVAYDIEPAAAGQAGSGS